VIGLVALIVIGNVAVAADVNVNANLVVADTT
jgi:hypothetical protein